MYFHIGLLHVSTSLDSHGSGMLYFKSLLFFDEFMMLAPFTFEVFQ